MKNDFDQQQFDQIAKLETDVAVIKESIRALRQEMRQSFKSLEKKIIDNYDMLCKNSNTSEARVETRLAQLEDKTRKTWERVLILGIVLYIIASEVAPKLIGVL